MPTSPYPISDRLGGIVVGLCIAAAGAWVLISPPVSYEGLGLILTAAWGALLAAGGLIVALGHARGSYKVELPGITLALGGLAIYAFLSWQATFGDSPGSGPRALLMTAGAVIAAARLAQLLRRSRDARWAAEVRAE